MTGEKILDVIELYRKLFEERNIGKIDYPHKEILCNSEIGLEHVHGMLDKMVEFVHAGRIEKAFRWLGFVQGVIWVNGEVMGLTLEDLKNHNRP